MIKFQPFWQSDRIQGEIVVFAEKNGKITGHLAFDGPSNVFLTAPDGRRLKQGEDYSVRGNEICLLNCDLPHFQEKWLKNVDVPADLPSENKDYGIEGCLLVSPRHLKTMQFFADYDCLPTAVPAVFHEDFLLPSAYTKLTENKKLKLVLMGDSVCNAANSSWEMGFPGYTHWLKPALDLAERLFDAEIEFENVSRSGYGTEWGKIAAKELFANRHADLVVIGLCGNDAPAEMPVETVVQNTREIMQSIAEVNPGAEFIILSPVPQNPDCAQYYKKEFIHAYPRALKELEKPGVAVVDLDGIFHFLLKRKRYCEFSGNNLNHPNDFWYRFYTDAFSYLFYRLKENGNKLRWAPYFSVPAFEEVRFPELPANIRGGYLITAIKGCEYKTFAFVGEPAGGQKKCPAVVLVHGGGGNASWPWVREWTNRGYVAVAVDLGCFHFTDGDLSQRKVNACVSCFSIGGFAHILRDPRDSWIYYAVAQILSAHSYVRSLKRTDSKKTGIMGISWGGVVSLIALGTDHRFSAGAVVYSAGFITEDLLGTETGLFGDAEKKSFYDTYYDPQSYVSGICVPVLMQAGLHDAAFSPFSRQRTCDLFSYKADMAVIADLYHDNESNYANKNVYSFMDDRFRKTSVRRRVSMRKKGVDLHLRVSGNVDRAELLFSDGTGDPHTLQWQSIGIELRGNEARICPPERAGYAMAVVYYADGLYSSSDILELG